MKIWNFGSINIDFVYRVPSIVRPGETLAALDRSVFPGGKGLNQSLAIARAGCQVCHAGKIGKDGQWLIKILKDSGVDVSFISSGEGFTGHAIIQVDDKGENSIVLYPGENFTFSIQDISSLIDQCAADDWVLLQNETNLTEEVITLAAKKGLKVAFNPAPANSKINSLPLDKITLLILNQIELEMISGFSDLDAGLKKLKIQLPDTHLVVTLGKEGSIYQFKESQIHTPAKKVKVVDTTGAGDTFVGYFLAEFAGTGNVSQALMLANQAAALSVAKKGAGSSIPYRSEIK